MSKTLYIDENVNDGIKKFLRCILENGKVKGVLTLINEGEKIAYSLISNPELIKYTVPLYPIMPLNAARSLSHITLSEPISEPIAVVIKPCEIRAFIELVKRSQGSVENIFFISFTCGGVYPIKMNVNGKINEKIDNFWRLIEKNEIDADLRTSCKVCKEFIPYNTDMTIFLAGNREINNQCRIFLNTDRAEDFAESTDGNIVQDKINTELIDELKVKRLEERKKLFEDKKIEKLGLEGLIDIFGRCISCHACGNACPICYCSLCYFDSQESEYKPVDYESELEKRGAIRVPPNTVTYQVGRLIHVGISCVGCGCCEDVCPSEIQLSTIFIKGSESIQEKFNYIPGKNPEELIPISTFDIKEFPEVET